MDIRLTQLGRFGAWLHIGKVEVFFLNSEPRAFLGPTGWFKRGSLSNAFDECEELEEAVFACRLEEAIVDGLVASDQGGQ